MRTLSDPKKRGLISVEEAIAQRRSLRCFSEEPLSEEDLSQLLWSAQGITDPARGFRASPSAGATYPLETYLVLPEGVFHYLPQHHGLEEVKRGDFRAQLTDAALGQSFIRHAPAVIVFTAVPERAMTRYGHRGAVYIQLEAGHAAATLQLQAVALGLGAVPIGAFEERKVERTIGAGQGETAVYIIPVGRPK